MSSKQFTLIFALCFVVSSACDDASQGGGIVQSDSSITPATGGLTGGMGGVAGGSGGVVGRTGGTTSGTGGAMVGSGGMVGRTGGTPRDSGGSVAVPGGTTSVAGGTTSVTGGTVVRTGGTTSGTGGTLMGTGGAVGTGGVIGTGGAVGTGGVIGTGGITSQDNPVCENADPSKFQPNMKVGGGGSSYKESAHFIVFGASSPDTVLNFMEAAQKCFVEDWCWRSPSLSITSNDGKYSKLNIYAIANLNAGGYMGYDNAAGLSYIQVLANQVTAPRVTVHEYGHALTLAAKGWVDQTNTGFWWESVANFVADTFLTSTYCEPARKAFGLSSSNSLIDLNRTIGNAQWAICMNQNYYQAWPFLTYLTNNPDNYAGLGRMTLPNLFKNHKGNNETPLHVLERMASPITVQAILGRYWARMAYLDIAHPQAQKAFFDSRARLNFKNLSSEGSQTYKPLADRQPQYGGANIIPLTVTGDGTVSVEVTNLGNGLADSNFTATLSIRSKEGSVRYVDLPKGTGQATVGANEEASLVVVNTPSSLYMYDPSKIAIAASADPASKGLNYQVKLTGANPAH